MKEHGFKIIVQLFYVTFQAACTCQTLVLANWWCVTNTPKLSEQTTQGWAKVGLQYEYVKQKYILILLFMY